MVHPRLLSVAELTDYPSSISAAFCVLVVFSLVAFWPSFQAKTLKQPFFRPSRR